VLGRFGFPGDRRLATLWLAQAVSVFGDMLTFLAIPMLVYEATGSKAALSLTIFIRGVPSLLIGPFAGALADRLDRRAVLITSDLSRALLTIPIVFAGGDRLVSTIYAIVGLKAVIGVFFQPAMASAIPSIVERKRLMPVNSLFSFTFQTLQFIAPLAGAFLVGVIGIRALLMVDILSFGVSAWLIGLSRIPPHDSKRKQALTLKNLLREIHAGIVHVRGSKILVVILVTGLITQFGQGFISPAWLPYMVEVLGTRAASFGLLVSLQGLGCMVGSLLIMAAGIRNRGSVKGIYMFLLSATGVVIFMQTTTVRLPVFLIWATLVGCFAAGRRITATTLMQHATDQAMLGRVSSTFHICHQGALMLAVLIAGISSDWMTTRFLFVLACSLWLAGCIIGTILMAFAPEPKEGGQ